MVEMRIGRTTTEVWRFLKQLNIELSHDPAIPVLGIYPEKNLVQKDICTPTFIAALFTNCQDMEAT